MRHNETFMDRKNSIPETLMVTLPRSNHEHRPYEESAVCPLIKDGFVDNGPAVVEPAEEDIDATRQPRLHQFMFRRPRSGWSPPFNLCGDSICETSQARSRRLDFTFRLAVLCNRPRRWFRQLVMGRYILQHRAWLVVVWSYLSLRRGIGRMIIVTLRIGRLRVPPPAAVTIKTTGNPPLSAKRAPFSAITPRLILVARIARPHNPRRGNVGRRRLVHSHMPPQDVAAGKGPAADVADERWLRVGRLVPAEVLFSQEALAAVTHVSHGGVVAFRCFHLGKPGMDAALPVGWPGFSKPRWKGGNRSLCLRLRGGDLKVMKDQVKVSK
jgi:hypothetical protein